MKYIPQAYPFEMIDELIHAENGHSETQLTITADNILVENNYFTTAGLMENMAQTAAAGVGYACSLRNEAPTIGFIGAINKFQAKQLPMVGETIHTKIEPQHTIGQVQMVKGYVYLNQQLIASAEYKIFTKED